MIGGVVIFLLLIVGGVCAYGAFTSVDLSPADNTSMQNLTNTTAELAHFSMNTWSALLIAVVAGAVFAAVWCLAIRNRKRRRR